MKALPMSSLRNALYIIILLGSFACSHKVYQVQNTQTQRLFITDSLGEREDLNQLIQPYKEKMAEELDRVLTYAPMDLNFEGANSNMSNFVADLMFEEGNRIYTQQHPNQKIDMVLTNRGGLRRTFTKGDLTVKSIYELMPFENEAVIVTLSGDKVEEMIDYLRNSTRNHPIAGIKLYKNPKNTKVIIGEQAFDKNKKYRVLTNDYLQKGGDQMSFFLNPIKVEYLQIRLRDMFINRLGMVDTISIDKSPRYLD